MSAVADHDHYYRLLGKIEDAQVEANRAEQERDTYARLAVQYLVGDERDVDKATAHALNYHAAAERLAAAQTEVGRLAEEMDAINLAALAQDGAA